MEVANKDVPLKNCQIRKLKGRKNLGLQKGSLPQFTKETPIVGTPPFCRGGWASNQIFKKEGGFTGPQLLEEGCWERGGNLFQGRLQFSTKNKLKSEIFNDKKSL